MLLEMHVLQRSCVGGACMSTPGRGVEHLEMIKRLMSCNCNARAHPRINLSTPTTEETCLKSLNVTWRWLNSRMCSLCVAEQCLQTLGVLVWETHVGEFSCKQDACRLVGASMLANARVPSQSG